MKKLFTLLLAMAMVTMSFAQLNESIVTNVQNNNIDRSNWYGFFSNSANPFIFDSEAEYLLRVPAGAIPVGSSITKVRFVHLTSENFGSNYTGIPFGAEEYIIKFYTGTTYVPTTYIGGDLQEHTYDSLNPGTLAYSMVYAPTETGLQEVTLTDAFTVPSSDFCVSIYCAERTACGVCSANDACATLSYFYMYDTAGWLPCHYGNDTYKPWLLSIYFDDGTPYQPESDWIAEIYNPDDEATYPFSVQRLYFDVYDTLYFYCGAFNMGPDSSYGDYFISIYLDGETPSYFVDHQQINEVLCTYDQYHGLSYGPISLMATDELWDWGLSMEEPFDVCFNFTYESAPDYSGIDPNLGNNTYCVTYYPDTSAIIHNIAPEENKAADIILYPNPTTGIVTVRLSPETCPLTSEIRVFDVYGRMLNIVETFHETSLQTVQIDLSQYTPGIYLVKLVNNGEVIAVRKMVKE